MASDEWCRERLSIDGFNEACKNISAISLKVRDESMGAIVFQTTAKGNLPQLSHDLCKTEPPGTQFKTVACSVIGDLLLIEVKRGKEGMKYSKHHQHLGETAACTNIIMVATKGVGPKYIKGATKGMFYF